MKATVSSDYIKEMKASIKVVNESMKRIAEAERIQDSARNCRDYDNANRECQCANIEMMNALEEMVRLASAMGCNSGLYNIHKYHKIVELDFRDSNK